MNNDRFPIFFFLIFLSIFMPGFGGLMGIAFSFIPIIISIVVFFNIFKAITTTNQQAKKRTTNKTGVNQNPYSKQNQPKKFVSNQERNQIDEKLKEYFKKNYKLPILDDIALVTQNGTYTSFENLYVSKNGETILSLEEFGNMFPSTYAEIIALLKVFVKQDEKVMSAEVKTPKVKVEDKLSDADKYIDKINNLNIDIPQAEIKNGLYQTCALLRQIDLASKASKTDSKIGKLYDYYLPILVSILENYKALLVTGSQNDEFKKCETQLIKTIILINEALKNINNSMHEDEYMNLSADITTLQSLLKKDGLVKEGTIYDKGEENGK